MVVLVLNSCPGFSENGLVPSLSVRARVSDIIIYHYELCHLKFCLLLPTVNSFPPSGCNTAALNNVCSREIGQQSLPKRQPARTRWVVHFCSRFHSGSAAFTCESQNFIYNQYLMQKARRKFGNLRIPVN